MRYKVGDKVKVKSLEDIENIGSYDINNNIIHKDGNMLFVRNMFYLCGHEFIIEKTINGYYFLKDLEYSFEDWMLEDVVEETKPNSTPRNKYDREILPNTYVDVYDVLRAFEVTDQALGHLIKKALAVGKRGHKTAEQDYKDILDSAQRAYDQYKQWSDVNNG